MTAKQINAMDAGPEMDRLVAEAIGLKRNGNWWEGQDHFKTLVSDTKVLDPMYADETRDHFSPSTDWNDAMFAAEKFGLFDYSQCGMSLGKYMTAEGYPAWSVYDAEEFYMRGEGYSLYEATTGPLAICRAILALANAIPTRS